MGHYAAVICQHRGVYSSGSPERQCSLQQGTDLCLHFEQPSILLKLLSLASLWNAMLHNSTKTQRKKIQLQKIKSLIIKHLKCWTDIRKYATLYILMRIKSYMVSP